jgi:hypothetical protein
VDKLIKEQETQDDPKKRQSNVREVLESIKMDKAEQEKLIREATAQERAAKKAEAEEEEVDAEKEAARQLAKRNLEKYVTDDPIRLPGYKRWGDKIAAALRLLGMSEQEITRIGQLPTSRARKVEVGKFLNMPEGRNVPRGPAPAQPTMRVIQTQTYTEYIRLRNQYVSDPNVFVQAPQNKPGTLTQQSIQPTIDLSTRVPSSIFQQEGDLSRTQIKP